jgi:hypothetical protein
VASGDSTDERVRGWLRRLLAGDEASGTVAPSGPKAVARDSRNEAAGEEQHSPRLTMPQKFEEHGQ